MLSLTQEQNHITITSIIVKEWRTWLTYVCVQDSQSNPAHSQKVSFSFHLISWMELFSDISYIPAFGLPKTIAV